MLAFYYGDAGAPGPSDVHIGKTAVVMPLNRILLIRQGAECCALKFTAFWTGKTEDDLYAKYESYHVKSGDSAGEDVKFKTGKLSFPKPRGIGRLAFSFGNKEIECGPVKLLWSGQGSVHFYGGGQPQGDYGVELAPTKWTSISQVNVSDPRLKWYRFDEGRDRVNIPVDRLWEDGPVDSAIRNN